MSDLFGQILGCVLLALVRQPVAPAILLISFVASLQLSELVLVSSGPPSLGVAWLVKRCFALERVRVRAIGLLVRNTVITLDTIAVLETIGFNSTALFAIAGGLSVGLGCGVKEVFGNFVSGLWLLFEGSLRPGDIVALDGDFCEVRRLGLRATRLWRDRDNAELVITNQTFFNTSTVESVPFRRQCLATSSGDNGNRGVFPPVPVSAGRRG